MEAINQKDFETYKNTVKEDSDVVKGHLTVDGKLLKVTIGEKVIAFPMNEVRKVFMDA